MPEFISRLGQQAVNFWNNLEKSQKTRILITSAVVVIAVAAGMILLTRPTYITLISNVDKKQIAEMSTILQENNIPSEIGDDGTSIRINSRDNNAAQIALAQEGYPKGGLTFEDAISLIGIGTTESDKKHIWREQRISDIAAKLRMLDNVEMATVDLAIPERSIFISPDSEQPRPTAYVMIKPKERLTPKQVEGIVMIVSRSVENLDPKDVTVVDNNSNILNDQNGDESMTKASSQEEMRINRERELEKKVYEYFNVGQFDNFDTLRVVANAVLDFDVDRAQQKLISNPQGMQSGALLSTEKKQIDLINGGVGGVPGMETNPGEAPTYQIGEEGNSEYSEKSSIENYAYDETLRETEKAAGKLIPQESSMAISLWYGKKAVDDSGLTDEFINQIREAASSATGIPVSNIVVNKLKMGVPEVVQQPTGEKIKELISEYGFFAVILLLIAGLLIAALARRKDMEFEPELAVAGEAAAAASKFVVPDREDYELPEIDLEERSEVKKQIDKFVKQKPDAVAQLLRNWLADDWDI
jgi:flagellar M-ring protein FliF